MTPQSSSLVKLKARLRRLDALWRTVQAAPGLLAVARNAGSDGEAAIFLAMQMGP